MQKYTANERQSFIDEKKNNSMVRYELFVDQKFSWVYKDVFYSALYHPFCTQIITLRDENLLDRFFLFIISSGEMKIMKTFIDKVLNV